jgi:UDP-N-acetylglucosamine 3-dehydrogenase
MDHPFALICRGEVPVTVPFLNFTHHLSGGKMSKLGVAILGAGNMGRCLGQALCKISEVEVRYICDSRIEAAEALAPQFGSRPLGSLEELYRQSDFEAAVICLPTFTRLESLRQAVAAGKHIFCEKPLALNPAMAEAIQDLLRGYPKTVMVGQVLRFFWEYGNLREMVLEGRIGQIGTIRLSRCVGYPGNGSWYTEEARSGGLILDLLIHDLDFLLWTFGEVKQVFAQSVKSQGTADIDYALLHLQMKSGALAHLEGSWAHPVGSFRQTVELAGSGGILSYDSATAKSFDLQSTLEKDEMVGSRISLPETDPEHDPYFLELKHFVECVREDQAVKIPWQEALKACVVAFCALESAKKGIPIPLNME